jgi:methylated-DNA-[protein]-cysteine S-methyltransferase
MMTPGFALFDTAVGRCGIAWNERAVCSVRLPGARVSETRAHLAERVPQGSETTPPPAVQRALDRIITLLRGEATDLSQIDLDMTGVPPFQRRVYEHLRGVPAGATLSYGELATRLGSPGSARAVGQA